MDNTTKLSFQTGVKRFQCNGGAFLEFNPTDQNVYARFINLYMELPDILKGYEDISADFDIEAKEDCTAFTAAVKSHDDSIKSKLSEMFGSENDFDAILGTNNAMALTESGATVLENFLEAILPEIEADANKRLKLMQDKIKKAKEKQAVNRAQRRALK